MFPGHLFEEIDVLVIKQLKKALLNMPDQEVVVWV